MAGLELVQAVKTLSPSPRTWKGDLHPYKHLQFQLEAYGRGETHDVGLSDATLYGELTSIALPSARLTGVDYIMCVVSIATAAVCNPVLVVTRLWPYIALLTSFAGFVVWNGGVVLGNFFQRIHLRQVILT